VRPRGGQSIGWTPVGRLQHDGDLYRFFYTKGARTPGFVPFSQMENLDQIYESEEMFPLFANRLLSRRRPEWEYYLRSSGFDLANPPDPIVILEVTEGIRETDAVEVFPCPVPDQYIAYINKFFMHGMGWFSPLGIDRASRLVEGERLKLMFDFQNDHDPRAVAVRTEDDRLMIGYIPRYLAHDVWRLCGDCSGDGIELKVMKVNASAPLEQRVLCDLRACWPDGFRPCEGELFEPIPQEVLVRCGGD
jgi:hypothetical protein